MSEETSRREVKELDRTRQLFMLDWDQQRGGRSMAPDETRESSQPYRATQDCCSVIGMCSGLLIFWPKIMRLLSFYSF